MPDPAPPTATAPTAAPSDTVSLETPPRVPLEECDLIMKGGITSGVVYPQAVVRIARDYRLRSIGGSSAGAIAACFAAAAEYRRQSGGGDDMAGFHEVSALSADLAENLRSLFQPRPRLAPLFALLMGAVSGNAWGAVRRIWRVPMVVAAALLVLLLEWAWLAGNFWAGVTALLAVPLGLVLWIALPLLRLVTRDLPAANFGLCPGLTQPGHDGPGLTDWMHAHLQRISGKPPEAPLLAGDLARHGIQIAAMTTDLSTQRPYQLPLSTRIHYFSLAEWRHLFPAPFLDALIAGRTPLAHGQDHAPADLYQLPVADDFPVLLVARMSLSFPGLIEAIPLWRHDEQIRLPGPEGRTVGRLARCLFSDGGISSNFPIHFFDSLLPSRPTFGIALTSWDPARHREDRVHLPRRNPVSSNLPVQPITRLSGFLMAILNTAKDWQDTLQGMLPGYAERVVTVRLDDATEGGMNLDMPPAVIDQLSEYGAEAGEALVARYSYAAGARGFDAHRQLRGRITIPKLAEALGGFGTAMGLRPVGAPGALTGREALERGEGRSERPEGGAPRPALSARCLSLADDLAELETQGCDSDRVSDATIRLVAVADRVPRRSGSA